MSAISLKSITGITSITTPAGVDNQLTLHNNNTSEAVKLDAAGNLHFHNHLNITGVSTASNFKTGTSNLHNTGLNVQDLDVDGHTELDDVRIAGVATFYQGGSEVVRINSGGLLLYNDLSFFGASTHAYWDRSANQFLLNDNTKLTLGSSSDYEVYHDGSNAVHRVTGDGDLKLLVEEKNFIVQGTGGHQIIKGIDNGAVELYFNNSKKFETGSYGFGTNENIRLNVDLGSIQFGAGQDLKIYHDGTNDRIDSSGTFLILEANNHIFRNIAGNEDYAKFLGNGAVELYHNGSKKFETTSTGVVVSGICTATSFSGDGSALTGITQTTINNYASTRIVTATNNANELDAETNLTVNGSVITFAESTLTVSKSTLATVSAKETTGNKEIALRANTTGGVLRTIGSYPLIFEIAQAEKIRIDTSGRLHIGTTTNRLGEALHVLGYGIVTSSAENTNMMIFGTFGGSEALIGSFNSIPLIFRTANTERLRITTTGLLLGGSDAEGNTTLGGNAGDSFSGTSAIQNTLIGKDAGTAISNGDQHTALGYNALKALTSNGGCTAIGANALEDCTAGGNTAVGLNVLKETVSGQNNTAMGQDAAVNNIGNLNIAIGRDAMKASNHNAGHDNVVIGSYAAYQAPHIYRNVIIGRSALSETSNTNGNHNNVIIGYEAGRRLSHYIAHNVILGAHAMDGGGAGGGLANQYNISDNIAIGRYAFQNTRYNSNNNIVIGQEAGQNAATGTAQYSNWTHNIAIGYRCLRDATGGSDAMVAIGPNALEYHTGDGDGSSGGYTVAYGGGAFRNNRHVRHSVAVGNNAGTDWNPAKSAMHEGGCTFIGGGAGRQHSTGTSNIAVGRDSLNNVVTGTHNVAVGNRCFERITSGSHNCAVTGLYGALFVSTGDYNNFFGSLAGYAYDQANATATGDHNNIFGGYSKSSGNNNDHENIFGGGLTGKGANTTFIKGAVYNSNNSSSFSTTSDERIKKNIVDNNTGLDAIEKIRVRNFEYRTKNEITDFDNPEAVVVKDKSGVQVGVIAQEIKDILPDVVKQNTTGAYTVDPDNLTWYLVNAVKELSAEVKSLKAQINS